jgi:hypothetical protein
VARVPSPLPAAARSRRPAPRRAGSCGTRQVVRALLAVSAVPAAFGPAPHLPHSAVTEAPWNADPHSFRDEVPLDTYVASGTSDRSRLTSFEDAPRSPQQRMPHKEAFTLYS